jgi:L-asparaginase
VQPFISLIATGGTLSEVRNAQNLTTGPVLTAERLLGPLPLPTALPPIRSVNLPFKRSDDLTISDLIELAAIVTAETERGAAGIVVAHGTDTLEETAFGLDLLLSAEVPVVVTGAIRPHQDPGADGPANLLGALLVAAEPAASGLGVVVAFDDTIHAARYVEKTHVSRPPAFASRAAGPIGWIVEGRVRVGCRLPRQRRVVPVGQDVPMVAVVKLFLGCDERVITAVASLGCEGLVVEGFGGGHVPQRLAEPLGRLAGEIPVVITTRVSGGEVLRSSYGTIGDEVDLRARGLLSGGILNSAKAHVGLSLLLSGTAGNTLREMFEDIACGSLDQAAASGPDGGRARSHREAGRR